MKKHQNKSKVEVVEPKSVANKCDYCRTNGKCGRALSEMFGKLCPGRSCEDWKCDAEEDSGEAVSSPLQNEVVPVHPEAVRTPLLHSGDTYRDRVSGQYAAIGTAKDNLMRECVKFGALLTEVSYYLGEARGRGKGGEGLQAWLEENCPEINYNTAMGYKSAAAKFVKMIGGGSQAVAVLQDKTEVIPPGEDAPVEVDAKFIEKRDQLFNDVKSRRELEQTYFKFMAHETKGRRGGANKGQSGTGRRALTVEEQAKSAADEFRELIGSLFAYVVEQKKVALLTAEEQEEFIGNLKRIAKSAEEMVG